VARQQSNVGLLNCREGEGATLVALNAFYGIQVTLSDTNPHQLLPLLIAVDSTLSPTTTGGGILQNVATLQIQADQNNAGNYVMVGDSNLSLTRYGLKMSAGQAQYLYREGMAIPLSAVYVQASAATCYVNVMIVIM